MTARMRKTKVNLDAVFKTTNPVYLPHYWIKERYYVGYGGAGSGKSRFIGQKILVRMLTETPHRFLIVRKVATTLRKSVFQLMCDYISKYGLSKLFTIKKGEMRIECVNGNQIYFLGLDDVEKLKSIEGITSIWIEEASEVTEDDFIQLDLRLRGHTANYQQIILSFNPISETHWLKKVFFDVDKPDTRILKTTYLDNIFIDDRYKQVLEDLKGTNDRMYNIYALGNWGALKGLALEPYESIRTIPSDLDLEWTYGMDFGFSAPSTFVRIAYHEEAQAFYLDEVLYEAGKTKPQLIKQLNGEVPEFRDIVGFGDSAEPATIKEFVLDGWKMKPAHKDTNMSIDFVNRHTVYITRRSTNLRREWENYKWKLDKNGDPTDVIVKEDDHVIDAVRYGCYTKWGIAVDSKGVVSDKQMSAIKDHSKYTPNMSLAGY